MALLDTASDYFHFGDWRNPLKDWIKNNCADPLQYLKMVVAEYRLIEDLSWFLVDRKKSGFKATKIHAAILSCGKFGACQENKTSKERRYIGHYCNQRGFHLPCAIRYRNGQGIEARNQFLEIIKAQDLWGFYAWTFTLSDKIRAWIDLDPFLSKKFLMDVRRAVSKTIKASLGINTKTRGIQPGFHIMFHPVSSGDPFTQSSHFHSLVLPLLVNSKTGEITKFPRRIDHALVKANYKKYLDKVLLKYGQCGLVRDRYVVRLRSVDVENESSVNHAFRYNNRSQVADILQRVKRVDVDFNDCVCLLIDKQNDVFIPVIKSKEEMLDALEYVLNPLISIRMAYGFMRVLPKYADILGIEQDEYQDDENWSDVFFIDILRMSRNRFDKKLGRVVRAREVWIRKRGDPGAFKRLRPDEIRGEKSCMSDRKLYKSINGQ